MVNTSIDRCQCYFPEKLFVVTIATAAGSRNSITRNLGLDHQVVDCIQCHAARTAGEAYGDVTVQAMTRVVATIPRIEISFSD
jgi:hypothetical protein